MATNSQIAFNPQGKTVVVAATNPAPTGVQALVGQGMSNAPAGQYRIVNAGNVTVHLGVGASAAAAQANAVAAAAGVPAAGIPLVAGAVEILRFGAETYFSGFSSTAATVYITPGEGL
jgi:hypothetical protein